MTDHASFALHLKDSTRENHVRAERHPIQQAIAQGRIDRATWGRLVAQNRAVHAALESAFEAASTRDPRLARLFAPHHRRLANYDADLTALAVPETDRSALPATAGVTSWIRELAQTEPIALIGVLYVIEGSTNGGQYLARVLGPALQLREAGLSALNPHGPKTTPLWHEFRATLDSIGLSSAEQQTVIASARETFDALGRVFDAVAERNAPVAPAAS